MTQDEYTPSDPQSIFALDRLWVWKQALAAVKASNVGEYVFVDVLELARFMVGDDLPTGSAYDAAFAREDERDAQDPDTPE